MKSRSVYVLEGIPMNKTSFTRRSQETQDTTNRRKIEVPTTFIVVYYDITVHLPRASVRF